MNERPSFIPPENWLDVLSGRRNLIDPLPPEGFRYCDCEWKCGALLDIAEEHARAKVQAERDRRRRKRLAYRLVGLRHDGNARKGQTAQKVSQTYRSEVPKTAA